MKGIGTAVITLLLVVLIIYLSYVCSKYIGKGLVARKHSGYMKIIDQMAVGQDKSVAVIQTGTHYYLIGIASAGITLLSEVSGDDLIRLPDEEAPMLNGTYPSFKVLVEKLEQLKNKKK